MADVPLAQLPTVDDAKALQKSRALASEKAGSPPQAPPPELSQAERTGMSFDERREQIAAIRKPCDNVHAFKNALEEAGYVLARGDKWGFVLVDGQGQVFSLSKHLAGDLKGKEYKALCRHRSGGPADCR